MANPPPPLEPGAPRRDEIIRQDLGGWISGPSVTAEEARADDIRPGDRLLLDDGTVAEVDAIRHGQYLFPEGRKHGVALIWKSGPRSSGMMSRRASQQLQRLAGEEKDPAPEEGDAAAT